MSGKAVIRQAHDVHNAMWIKLPSLHRRSSLTLNQTMPRRGRFPVRPTHHHASFQQQIVHSLCDIGSVHQVVVGVFVFAVSHF